MTTKDYLNIPCTWDMDEVRLIIDNTESLYNRMTTVGNRLAERFYKNPESLEHPRISTNFICMSVVRSAIDLQRAGCESRNDWVRLTTVERRAVYIQWLYDYAKELAENWRKYPDAYIRTIENVNEH